MSQYISSLWPLFLQNIFFIPQIIIYIVGLRISMKYRNLNSKHVGFLIIAFSIFLATLLIGIAMQILGYLLFRDPFSGAPSTTYANILTAKVTFQYIFNIVGWVYILRAIAFGIKEIET